MSYKMEGRKSDDTRQSVITLFREFATLFEWSLFTLRPACDAKKLQSEPERLNPCLNMLSGEASKSSPRTSGHFLPKTISFCHLYYMSESRMRVG